MSGTIDPRDAECSFATMRSNDVMIAPMQAVALPTASRSLSYPWLLADIGGTNARFAWLDETAGSISYPGSFRVVDHADVATAARAYLAQLQHSLGARYHAPRAAAWAVASAVAGDRITFTNAGWSFSRQAVQGELGLERLLVLNDFEALALALPHLQAAQLQPISSTAATSTSTSTSTTTFAAVPSSAARAVIGPGTGLGVAGLVACPGEPGDRVRWVAVPGEGGHASIAAADAFEGALLEAVRRDFAHVSAERLLSGIGLPVLHRAVGVVLGKPTQELDAKHIVTAGVAALGTAGADALCRATLEHFCALLGGFAGNVALTFGARGGVYVGGGIVPRLGELFAQSRFRERFEAKGRLEGYLRAIPTWLVVDTRAALAGAAAALESLESPEPVRAAAH
jgi:glucokinase